MLRAGCGGDPHAAPPSIEQASRHARTHTPATVPPAPASSSRPPPTPGCAWPADGRCDPHRRRPAWRPRPRGPGYKCGSTPRPASGHFGIRPAKSPRIRKGTSAWGEGGECDAADGGGRYRSSRPVAPAGLLGACRAAAADEAVAAAPPEPRAARARAAARHARAGAQPPSPGAAAGWTERRGAPTAKGRAMGRRAAEQNQAMKRDSTRELSRFESVDTATRKTHKGAPAAPRSVVVVVVVVQAPRLERVGGRLGRAAAARGRARAPPPRQDQARVNLVAAQPCARRGSGATAGEQRSGGGTEGGAEACAREQGRERSHAGAPSTISGLSSSSASSPSRLAFFFLGLVGSGLDGSPSPLRADTDKKGRREQNVSASQTPGTRRRRTRRPPPPRRRRRRPARGTALERLVGSAAFPARLGAAPS